MDDRNNNYNEVNNDYNNDYSNSYDDYNNEYNDYSQSYDHKENYNNDYNMQEEFAGDYIYQDSDNSVSKDCDAQINTSIKEGKKRDKLKTFGSIIIAILIMQVLFLTFFLGTNKKIFKNVYVSDINLGGLTRSEAQKVLEDKLKSDITNRTIVLYYGDYKKEVQLGDIVGSLDYAKIARQAQQVGRKGTLFERYMQVVNLNVKRVNLGVKFTVNMTELRNVVYALKDEVDSKPVDATISKEHGRDFVITKEKNGVEMDVAKTIDYFRKCIEENELEELNYSLRIDAKDILPKKTKEQYESYSSLLSSFVTDYKRQDDKRQAELIKISTKLDKTMIKPGETFSFNKVLETPKVAYKEGNEDVYTQLATTLYNAALKTNLEIVERKNTITPLSYIDIAKDAYVSDKSSDLKIKNITTNPLYIESYVLGGKLYVKIYGSKNFKVYESVTFRHEILKIIPALDDEIEIDKELEEGKKVVVKNGTSGYVAKLYGIYKKVGHNKREVLINESTYKPSAGLVKVGLEKSKEEKGDENEDKDKEKDKDIKNDDEQVEVEYITSLDINKGLKDEINKNDKKESKDGKKIDDKNETGIKTSDDKK